MKHTTVFCPILGTEHLFIHPKHLFYHLTISKRNLLFIKLCPEFDQNLGMLTIPFLKQMLKGLTQERHSLKNHSESY